MKATNIKRRFWAGITGAILFAAIASPLFISTKAHATIPDINQDQVVGISFINASRVNLLIEGAGEQTSYPFTDSNPFDSTYNFVREDQGCTSTIRMGSSFPTADGPSAFTLDAQYVNGTGNCTDMSSEPTYGRDDIEFQNVERHLWNAYIIDEDNIFMPRFEVYKVGTSDRDSVFEANGLFRHFPSDVEDYDDSIYPRYDPSFPNNGYQFQQNVDEEGPAESQWIELVSGESVQKAKGCSSLAFVRECHFGSAKTLVFAPADTPIPNTYRDVLANLGVEVAEDGGVTIGTPGEAGDEDGDAGPSCESAGGAMGWILCPVILIIDGALNFLDTQISRLLDFDENRLSPEIEESWGIIRNLAYTILVPIMLVMVISTALGFEFVSAYTVKKALPRLVVAVIFIALSWEITSFLILVSNAVGAGTMGLLTFPFGDNVSTLSFADLFGAPGSIYGAIGGLVGNAVLFAGGILLIAFFWPSALAIMAIAFGVLMLRQIFIVALVMVAPLAILAWIFPGNDKLWKSWWSLFTKLLLMYPLIMGLIAVGRIFAYTVSVSDSAGLEGTFINPILKILAYVFPYAFIPLTFKFAGGVFGTLTGAMNDRTKGFFDKQRQSRGQKWEREVGRRALQKRTDMTGRLQSAASRRGRVGSAVLRGAARGVGGYNVMAADSARRAAVAKELNDQIATGRDEDIRGLTALDAYSYYKKNGQAAAEAAGLMKVGANGTRQFKSLGGKMVDEANVLAGKQRWGNDTFAQQAALSYEMRKAQTETELRGLGSRYGALASEWGMSDQQAGGAWIGAAFENQGQHLEYKYTDWKTGQMSSDKQSEFVKEVYEKKGSYPLAQMGSHTIERLKGAYNVASGLNEDGSANPLGMVDVDTQQRIAGIAETFMHEAGVGGQVGDVDGVPITAGGSSRRVASTPGAAHVSERVRELAKMTGVLDRGTSGLHIETDRSGQIGDNRREQK